MKKITNLLFFIIIVFGASSVKAENAPLPKIEKTAEFETESKEPEYPWEDEITIEGKTYYIKDTHYEILKKTPIMKQESVSQKINTTGLTSKEKPSNTNEINVTINKEKKVITGKLTKVKYKSVSADANQKVTAEKNYGDLTQEPTPEPTLTTSVKNTLTGKKSDVIVEFKEMEKGEVKWTEDTKVPIVIENYAADSFNLFGKKIKKEDALEEVKKISDTILVKIGYDNINYKITNVSYDGESYNENSTMKRKINLHIARKTRKYIAKYEGTLPIKATTYNRVATYTGNVEVPHKYHYKIKTIARYESNTPQEPTPDPTPIATKQTKKHKQKQESVKKSNTIVKVVGTVSAVLIILLLIVIILHQVSKKKKDAPKNDNKKRKRKESRNK